MTVVAVKVDKDNKVNITLEELNKMLNDAYNEGYRVGKDNNYTTPNLPPLTTPTTPISPYWSSGADIVLCTKTNIDDDLSVNKTI